MTTISLDDALGQELSTLARQSGKPLDQLLKEIILDYLEDKQDAALGDAAIDRLMCGESTTISLTEWGRQLDAMDN